MNWIDKILNRLARPSDFTLPGIVIGALAVVGLYALLAGVFLR